jgi:Lambda phage tail tube protein, TTP
MSAKAVATQGVKLQISISESPDVFQTIVNVTDFSQSGSTKVVDVSNVTDLWMDRFPTLLDVGEVTINVMWVPEDPTLNSSATGLRGLWQSKTLCDCRFIYNDGNSSTDSFQAYVTKYSTKGTQADVLKATITLSGTGQPSLV